MERTGPLVEDSQVPPMGGNDAISLATTSGFAETGSHEGTRVQQSRDRCGRDPFRKPHQRRGSAAVLATNMPVFGGGERQRDDFSLADVAPWRGEARGEEDEEGIHLRGAAKESEEVGLEDAAGGNTVVALDNWTGRRRRTPSGEVPTIMALVDRGWVGARGGGR